MINESKSNCILLHGDCLEIMRLLISQEVKVDAILTDPPYGSVQCAWDTVIPFKPMWNCLKSLVKPNGALVLFGSEPFSSQLRCSNLKDYRYDWVWKKDKAVNHLNCKKQPMRSVELISVFYEEQCEYNPQLVPKKLENIRPADTRHNQSEVWGSMSKSSVREIPVNMTYPKELISFRSCSADRGKSLHPTQKPVDLMEYLVKTYTSEGDTVLDFTAGSGTTGLACKNLARNFIGIEKDPKYYQIAKRRLGEETQKERDAAWKLKEKQGLFKLV